MDDSGVYVSLLKKALSEGHIFQPPHKHRLNSLENNGNREEKERK